MSKLDALTDISVLGSPRAYKEDDIDDNYNDDCNLTHDDMRFKVGHLENAIPQSQIDNVVKNDKNFKFKEFIK